LGTVWGGALAQTVPFGVFGPLGLFVVFGPFGGNKGVLPY